MVTNILAHYEDGLGIVVVKLEAAIAGGTTRDGDQIRRPRFWEKRFRRDVVARIGIAAAIDAWLRIPDRHRYVCAV
jgi:hypothetical protein